MSIGIYKITNPTGLIYIGASKNIEKRIAKGYKNKVGGKTRLIDASMLVYGYENHIFETVELCNVDQLNNRERHYQELFNCLHPNGLNKNLVACDGKKQTPCSDTVELIRQSKVGLEPWNKGLPTWESTKKTIRERYTPLSRSASKIILDTRNGVFYYCLREASETYGIPKQTLKMNLSAPNKENRKNKTHLIYV